MSVEQGQDPIVARILARAEGGVSNKAIATELTQDGILGWNETRVHKVTKAHFGPRRITKRMTLEAEANGEEVPRPAPRPRSPKAPEGVEPLTPTTPIPEDAPLAAYDWWVEESRQAYMKAKASGNTAAAATWARVSSQVLEARRKATPDKEADPNESPDYIRLAEQVEAKLLELVDKVLAGEV
jgi:hypothetical protein